MSTDQIECDVQSHRHEDIIWKPEQAKVSLQIAQGGSDSLLENAHLGEILVRKIAAFSGLFQRLRGTMSYVGAMNTDLNDFSVKIGSCGPLGRITEPDKDVF